jgi:hypothetical protein
VKGTKKDEKRALAPQEQSPIADAATTKGSHNQLEQPSDKPERRFLMTTDTKARETNGVDVTGMAKAWKEGYLKGLEASLQWQERNEHLMKETVRQGLTVPHQWFTASKSMFGKPWYELQGQTTGASNLFVTMTWQAMTRQVLQTSQDIAEPLLKTATDACETTFDYYKTAVAGPSRRFALEINKKVMDTVIPD